MRNALATRLVSIWQDGRTDSAGEDLFIVDIALHPTHQMLHVGRRRHLGRSLVMFRILPEVFEPVLVSCAPHISKNRRTYSSVAFISGHDVGEQNSVIDP